MSPAVPPVRVIFRAWRSDDEIIALFPDLPYNRYSGHIHSYMHVGQHGAADYLHCLRLTRPATVDEYAPLKRELETIGYTLTVRLRR